MPSNYLVTQQEDSKRPFCKRQFGDHSKSLQMGWNFFAGVTSKLVYTKHYFFHQLLIWKVPEIINLKITIVSFFPRKLWPDFVWLCFPSRERIRWSSIRKNKHGFAPFVSYLNLHRQFIPLNPIPRFSCIDKWFQQLASGSFLWFVGHVIGCPNLRSTSSTSYFNRVCYFGQLKSILTSRWCSTDWYKKHAAKRSY